MNMEPGETVIVYVDDDGVCVTDNAAVARRAAGKAVPGLLMRKNGGRIDIVLATGKKRLGRTLATIDVRVTR